MGRAGACQLVRPVCYISLPKGWPRSGLPLKKEEGAMDVGETQQRIDAQTEQLERIRGYL